MKRYIGVTETITGFSKEFLNKLNEMERSLGLTETITEFPKESFNQLNEMQRYLGLTETTTEFPKESFNQLNEMERYLDLTETITEFPRESFDNHAPASFNDIQKVSMTMSLESCGGNQRPTLLEETREMVFLVASMQPVKTDLEDEKPPGRKNVKMSTDPQVIAARHRREKVSAKMRILKRMVPGGAKMDTASWLDELMHYIKFLKRRIEALQHEGAMMEEAGIELRMANNPAPAPWKGYDHHLSSSSSSVNETTMEEIMEWYNA